MSDTATENSPFFIEKLLDRWIVYRRNEHGHGERLSWCETLEVAIAVKSSLEDAHKAINSTLQAVDAMLVSLLPDLDCDPRDHEEYRRAIYDVIEAVSKMRLP